MLSDYEQQRARNIASNNERLAELGLEEGGLAPKPKKANSKPKRQCADPEWMPERTTRARSRLAAAADSDGSSDDDDTDKDIPLPKRMRATKPVAKPKEVTSALVVATEGPANEVTETPFERVTSSEVIWPLEGPILTEEDANGVIAWARTVPPQDWCGDSEGQSPIAINALKLEEILAAGKAKVPPIL